MKKKIKKSLFNSIKYKLLMIFFFAFYGVGKIWLWEENVGNDFGLILGLTFLIFSIYLLVDTWFKLKTKKHNISNDS